MPDAAKLTFTVLGLCYLGFSVFRLYEYLEQSIIVELVPATNDQMQRGCLMLLKQISPQGRHTTPVSLMHAE